MAARRSRSARATQPSTEPVEGAPRASRGGEDDDPDHGEEGAGVLEETSSAGEDDDEPEDDEPEVEKLESQLEIEAAVALQKEENAAALRAHDSMQSKARGN